MKATEVWKLWGVYQVAISSIRENAQHCFEQRYPRPNPDSVLIVKQQEGEYGQATFAFGWCDEDIGNLSGSVFDFFWRAHEIITEQIVLPDNAILYPADVRSMLDVYVVERNVVAIEVWVPVE